MTSAGGPLAVREGVTLAPLTTLKVGGPARYFIDAESEDDIVRALAWADARALTTTVLGSGSNVVVSDRGVDGLVLRPNVRGLRERVSGDAVVMDVASGEPWDALVAHAVARGWAGLECLSGIPGDVGAAPVQNIGAYGQEVSATVASVRAVDRRRGRVVELDPTECAFGYRDSVFKGAARDAFVIVAVRVVLRRGGAPEVRYPELGRMLAARGGGPASLADVRAAVLDLRRTKSMLLDADDENGRSVGSFFTNPILPPEDVATARARIEAAGVLADGETYPRFDAPGGRTKLSAGWLIERAGFAKGFRLGAAGISTRHALALVNRGDASAADILELARVVRRGVLERFGVALTPEPVMLGFTREELAGVGSLADGAA